MPAREACPQPWHEGLRATRAPSSGIWRAKRARSRRLVRAPRNTVPASLRLPSPSPFPLFQMTWVVIMLASAKEMAAGTPLAARGREPLLGFLASKDRADFASASAAAPVSSTLAACASVASAPGLSGGADRAVSWRCCRANCAAKMSAASACATERGLSGMRQMRSLARMTKCSSTTSANTIAASTAPARSAARPPRTARRKTGGTCRRAHPGVGARPPAEGRHLGRFECRGAPGTRGRSHEPGHHQVVAEGPRGEEKQNVDQDGAPGEQRHHRLPGAHVARALVVGPPALEANLGRVHPKLEEVDRGRDEGGERQGGREERQVAELDHLGVVLVEGAAEGRQRDLVLNRVGEGCEGDEAISRRPGLRRMGGAPHRRRSFLVRVVPGNHLVRGVVFGILRHGHSARCHGRLEVPLYGPRAPPHAPPAQEAGQQDLDGQLVHRLQQREANHLHAQVAPAVLADKEVSPAQTVILGSGSPAAGAGARGDGAVHGGPPVDAFDAARVDVRLAVRVAQAPRVEEWQGVGLDECQVEEGTVRVDELEQKGLEDERVLPADGP
eukprot:scaffold21220_cov90-Isochrysis_galbana.AAC.1